MKKTLTINLAGMVYHIDDDAYSKLKGFLEALDRKLNNEPNKKEIIADIEARIAELLNERLNIKRQVVIMADIEYITETIGDPEMIFDETPPSDKTSSKAYNRKYRRMYRDPDNRMVAGVCSGLAAYWHLDPAVVRIVFVVLTIMGLSGLIIYLILLIVLPEAQTTAQKLEMRGEPVTIESIKNFFTKEFENVKNSFKK
jgi:phage shock protein PspC (stress-responsive transcriptional regulator)